MLIRLSTLSRTDRDATSARNPIFPNALMSTDNFLVSENELLLGAVRQSREYDDENR